MDINDINDETFLASMEQVYAKQFIASLSMMLESLSKTEQRKVDKIGTAIGDLLNTYAPKTHPAIITLALANILLSGVISSNFVDVLCHIQDELKKKEDIGVA